MTNSLSIENSTSTEVLSNGTTTNSFCVNPKYAALLQRCGYDSLDALFSIANNQTLSKPGLATWRERIRLTIDEGDKTIVAYLKRYNQPPKPARPVRYNSDHWARSYAQIEWAWAQELTKRDVACVEPIAFGETFVGRKEQRSAILLAEVAGQSLETWVSQWAKESKQVDRRLIKDIAELVASMHEAGFVHRDLYLSHIFFDPTSKSQNQLNLIDLQRVFRPSVFGLRWIIKDLAALHYSAPQSVVSQTNRLRWLRWYAERSKVTIYSKALAYRIIGKAARMSTHDNRRLARLA